jgi:hypothetical protein
MYLNMITGFSFPVLTKRYRKAARISKVATNKLDLIILEKRCPAVVIG